MSQQWHLSAHQSGQPDCDDAKSVESFTFVEAEIQPSSDLSSGIVQGLRDRLSAAGAGRIGVYGPWIYDKGHCCHSEIHPAEQIWWREDAAAGPVLHLNVICDASKRFWWRSQMDDGTKLKPWGAPPIVGVFAVAFEVDVPDAVRPSAPVTFEVSLVSGHNVATVSSGSPTSRLEYQGRTLIRFVPNSDAFTVTFEQVGTAENGRIRGFLVLETSVGRLRQRRVDRKYPAGTDVNSIPEGDERKVFRKEEGHHMFTLSRRVEAPVVG